MITGIAQPVAVQQEHKQAIARVQHTVNLNNLRRPNEVGSINTLLMLLFTKTGLMLCMTIKLCKICVNTISSNTIDFVSQSKHAHSLKS